LTTLEHAAEDAWSIVHTSPKSRHTSPQSRPETEAYTTAAELSKSAYGKHTSAYDKAYNTSNSDSTIIMNDRLKFSNKACCWLQLQQQ
jgi:hypothetical protein